MPRILIVDDDPVELSHTVAVVASLGYDVVSANSGEAALALLRRDPLLAAIVLDLVMPDRDGMAVLEAMAAERLATPAIVAATSAAPETVASLLRAGAVDFLDKPAQPARLIAALANARRHAAFGALLRDRPTDAGAPDEHIASGPGMERVLAVCRKAAKSPLPLLIEGEPGTGRQHLARLVHAAGDRAARPFVAIDCASFAPGEAESALFGQPGVRGAAAGRVPAAHGGTVLLNEIGELPLSAQRVLRHLLETGEIVGPGGNRPQRVNIRLIATSSRRLLNLARSGEIDAALYDRLNVLPLYLPPLRQRHTELAALAGRLLARLSAEAGRHVTGISPDALALLAGHDWPGNVRELENALWRAIALARSPMLEPADFPQILTQVAGRDASVAAIRALGPASAPVHIDRAMASLKQSEGAGRMPDRFLNSTGDITPLADLERELIVFALEKHRGRMSAVARALGIGRSTLYRKLRDYGLDGVEADAA